MTSPFCITNGIYFCVTGKKIVETISEICFGCDNVAAWFPLLARVFIIVQTNLSRSFSYKIRRVLVIYTRSVDTVYWFWLFICSCDGCVLCQRSHMMRNVYIASAHWRTYTKMFSAKLRPRTKFFVHSERLRDCRVSSIFLTRKYLLYAYELYYSKSWLY